jgi:hypothetical protein
MTEAEWLACTDPTPMLAFLRGKASDRKLRLFACACCRRIVHLSRFKACRNGVEVAERYADGLATAEERFEAFRAVGNLKEFGNPLGLATLWRDRATCHACLAVYEALMPEARIRLDGGATVPRRASEAVFARALRASARGDSAASGAARAAAAGEGLAQALLVRDIFGNPLRPVTADPSWLTPPALALAGGIYVGRSFDQLAILADALQDAGCDNEVVLNHCRSEGPHVRGCWVVDAILNRG